MNKEQHCPARWVLLIVRLWCWVIVLLGHSVGQAAACLPLAVYANCVVVAGQDGVLRLGHSTTRGAVDAV